jgi:hypothetical protein
LDRPKVLAAVDGAWLLITGFLIVRRRRAGAMSRSPRRGEVETVTVLISMGVLLLVVIVIAVVLAVRTASGGPYGNHGGRRR